MPEVKRDKSSVAETKNVDPQRVGANTENKSAKEGK